MEPLPVLADVALADLGDLIQSLVVFLFIFGPILSRVFGKKEEGKTVQPPQRRPQVPPFEAPAPDGEPVSWKDLLAGRVERLPDPPELVEEIPQVQAPSRVERTTARMEKEASAPEAFASAPFQKFDSSDLVSEDTLSHVPSEDELERNYDQEFEAADHLGAVGETEIDDVLKHTEVASIRRTSRHRILGVRGDLRRAVVMAEVLGRPLSLREEWNYAGPPSVQR